MDKQPAQTNRNRTWVTVYLLGVVGFTCIMSLYAVPKMMAMRDEVEDRQILYKCMAVLDANTIEVQLRGWEKPNPHPMVTVRIAGLDTPPLADAEDGDLVAWAERHGVTPEHAARMAASAHSTLVAFIRRQNMVLKPANGEVLTEQLQEGSVVHIYVGGTDVAHKQLQQGLAAHATAPPHLNLDLYAAAEAGARERKRGLWAER